MGIATRVTFPLIEWPGRELLLLIQKLISKVYRKGKDILYQGSWFDDYPHGYGVEHLSQGGAYEGEFSFGLKQGQGRLCYNGWEYTGQFENNEFNGKGEIVFSDGRKFKGNWSANSMDGMGVFEWSDGRKYFGEFRQSIKEGKGIFVWPDGRKFIGEWANGKQEGIGLFAASFGSLRKGVWNNGKRVQWEKIGELDDQIREIVDVVKRNCVGLDEIL